MSTAQTPELKDAIINFLGQDNCEHKTREVISQVKSTIPSSTSEIIRSAILSLIDEERVELTSDLSLKLHKE